jgi:hypothetical protein
VLGGNDDEDAGGKVGKEGKSAGVRVTAIAAAALHGLSFKISVLQPLCGLRYSRCGKLCGGAVIDLQRALQ